MVEVRQEVAAPKVEAGVAGKRPRMFQVPVDQ